MPHRWPKAILFDFDGVIVNSEPLHFLAFQEVLAAEGIEIDEDYYFEKLLGFDDKGSIVQAFADFGKELTPKIRLRVLARKSEAMMRQIQQNNFKPLDHAQEFVRGLWRKYPLAVCSGGLREEIELMLEGVALRDCFGVITAAEDVTKGKPDPEGYLLTMEKVGKRIGKALTPSDCLIIEDARSVIEEARKVGFRALGLASSSFYLDDMGSDWTVLSLDPNVVHEVIPQLKFMVS